MPLISCGYYIKARCIKDSWIAHASPVMREVWDYLLRTANHEDKKYSGFLVKRGQLFRSYAEIRDDLSWNVGYRVKRYSEDQMKHCMKMLRTQLMITLTKTPRGNLITVLNYDKFQDPKNYEYTNESTDEHAINPPTIHQHATAINKNDKNLKNKYIADGHADFKDTAGKIYDLYIAEIDPNKKSKQRAVKNIETWLNRGRLDSDLIFAFREYSKTMSKDRSYRKDPANFFGVNEDYAFDYLPVNITHDTQEQKEKKLFKKAF
jgi:hypothetical protein